MYDSLVTPRTQNWMVLGSPFIHFDFHGCDLRHGPIGKLYFSEGQRKKGGEIITKLQLVVTRCTRRTLFDVYCHVVQFSNSNDIHHYSIRYITIMLINRITWKVDTMSNVTIIKKRINQIRMSEAPRQSKPKYTALTTRSNSKMRLFHGVILL